MKKKRNWLEKFQAFWWDELTPSQRRCLWEVFTALRGPDKGEPWENNVKKGTTARIRYLLLGKEPKRFYGFVRAHPPSPDVTKKQVKKFGDHFYRHIQYAVHALKGVVKKSEMKDLLEIFYSEKVEKPGGVQ